jgi:siderophore synthetase component
MEIIERESAKITDRWKREHEAQRQEIQQLAQDRDNALMEAQMAKGEAQMARGEAQTYRAEIERYKNGRDSQYSAEVRRLQKEVQSWKSKYELAARRQTEVHRRLAATHARFSHTIIPVEEDGKSYYRCLSMRD